MMKRDRLIELLVDSACVDSTARGAPCRDQKNSEQESDQTALTIMKTPTSRHVARIVSLGAASVFVATCPCSQLTRTTNCTFRAKKVEGHDDPPIFLTPDWCLPILAPDRCPQPPLKFVPAPRLVDILCAYFLASRLGLYATGSRALSGEQIDLMDGSQLEKLINQIAVFYRVSPRHKHKIVKVV